MEQSTLDLFQPGASDLRDEALAPGAWLLRGFALTADTHLLTAAAQIAVAAPFRHLETPGGFRMSVAMTNCGRVGWISDRRGYRYEARDPLSGKQWPAMPSEFMVLARAAAAAAGFPDYVPGACLINRYEPGARLTLHQDRDEGDSESPIVSVSLGLPAVFLFGGMKRTEKQRRLPLQHGDAVVWGGPSRFRYHGVLPLKVGTHPLLGQQRLNLTFRVVASAHTCPNGHHSAMTPGNSCIARRTQ